MEPKYQKGDSLLVESSTGRVTNVVILAVTKTCYNVKWPKDSSEEPWQKIKPFEQRVLEKLEPEKPIEPKKEDPFDKIRKFIEEKERERKERKKYEIDELPTNPYRQIPARPWDIKPPLRPPYRPGPDYDPWWLHRIICEL